MTTKERNGAILLVAIFCLLGILLFFTVERPTGELRSIENNVIIEQRMKSRGLN
ncbi:MAG: hypothetical protein VCD00_04965 [Candidatus Hydrogenedentota bacterium]